MSCTESAECIIYDPKFVVVSLKGTMYYKKSCQQPETITEAPATLNLTQSKSPIVPWPASVLSYPSRAEISCEKWRQLVGMPDGWGHDCWGLNTTLSIIGHGIENSSKFIYYLFSKCVTKELSTKSIKFF